MKWYGYFSSTSVYGNHLGRWVDENTNLSPSSLRGKLRKKAEIQHLKFHKLYNLPIHIFRLPGIYGFGRSIFERLQFGKKIQIMKKGHFFSRIHVGRYSQCCVSKYEKVTPGETFNVCDDLPSQSDVVVKYAAKLMDVKKLETIDFNDPKINEKTKVFIWITKR